MGQIRITTGETLSAFGKMVNANKMRVRRMWLISPWISISSERDDPVNVLIEAIGKSGCDVRILTRPPLEQWHRKAIDVLRLKLDPVIMFNKYLHSKLYILSCDGFQYAMLGSPNFTRKANIENKEIAVEFRTNRSPWSDDVAAMILDLASYAEQLMIDDDSKLIQ